MTKKRVRRRDKISNWLDGVEALWNDDSILERFVHSPSLVMKARKDVRGLLGVVRVVRKMLHNLEHYEEAPDYDAIRRSIRELVEP